MTTDDIILDAHFIPAAPGVRFSGHRDDPDSTIDFITVADGTLIDLGSGRGIRSMTRKDFVRMRNHSEHEVEAVRQRVRKEFPTAAQVNVLPRSEQRPVLEAVMAQLKTADAMIDSQGKISTIRADRTDSYGQTLWIDPTRHERLEVLGYDLWRTGWMPAWNGTAPLWAPFPE